MFKRWGTLLAACLIAIALTGCGQVATEILESTTVLNTTDSEGPYEVKAVITGDLLPFQVRLVYSTDGWRTSEVVEMTKISEQVYQGAIPGQSAESVIHYYIRVEDTDSNILVEPRDVTLDRPSIDKTYSFRILQGN